MIIETTETIPCLLLPVKEKILLLPAAAVAEIVSYKETDVEIINDVPAWFVGMFSWRGIQIPLTILEHMKNYLEWDDIIEQTIEKNNKDNGIHIAVINRITKINSNIQVQKFRQYPFFAIVLKGAPKLIKVSRTLLNKSNENKEIDARFMMPVKMGNDRVLVPNLVNFWQIIDTLPSRLQWLGKIVKRTGDSR